MKNFSSLLYCSSQQLSDSILVTGQTPLPMPLEKYSRQYKKDLQLFKERVDMEKVYSSAIDDILSELKADGQPEHKMAATVIRGLKKISFVNSSGVRN